MTTFESVQSPFITWNLIRGVRRTSHIFFIVLYFFRSSRSAIKPLLQGIQSLIFYQFLDSNKFLNGKNDDKSKNNDIVTLNNQKVEELL